MSEKLRDSGISILGKISWGTHFCQFYENQESLIDILIPYIKAGLENNEYCLVITTELLRTELMERITPKSIPYFEQYMRNGQIEIINYSEWYLDNDSFNYEIVLERSTEKLEDCLMKGYDGLRMTSDISWIYKMDLRSGFLDYEQIINDLLAKIKIIALYTYPLTEFNMHEILEIENKHNFVLIKHNNSWNIIGDEKFEKTRKALRDEIIERERLEKKPTLMNEKLLDFLDGIQDVFFTLNKNWEFEFVNKQAATIVGKLPEDLVGKNIWKLFPEFKNTAHERAYQTAMNKKELQKFEAQGILTDKWYNITVHPYDEDIVIYWKDITERMELQEKLRESNDRFQFTTSTSELGIFEWHTPTDTTTWKNDRIYEIFGCSKEDGPINREEFVTDVIDVRDRSIFENDLKKAIQYHQPSMRVCRIRRKNDKELRWIKYATKFKYKSDGTAECIIGTIEDITEYVEKSHLLRKSEERLQLAAQSANFGTFEADYVNNTIYWSPETRFILGFPQDKPPPAPGKIPEFIHPEDIPLIKKMYQRVFSPPGESKIQEEHRIIRPDGTIRWVQHRGRVSFKGKGDQRRAIRANGILLDITTQKEREQEFERVHQKLQNTFESITDGLLILDHEWKNTYFNETGANIIGIHREDLIGRSVWEVFTRAKETKFYEGFHQAVETRTPVHFEEFYPEPLNLWLECHCYPSKDGLTVYFRDITENKKIEMERERLLAERSAIMENMEDALALADPEGKIIYHNPASLKLHGYSNIDEALLPKNQVKTQWELRDLSNNIIPIEKWPMYRALKGDAFQNYEVIVHRLDEDKKFIGNYSGKLVSNANGDPMFAFVTIRDVSEFKKLEQDLKILNRTLEERVEERTAELKKKTEELIIQVNEKKKAKEENLRQSKLMDQAQDIIISTDFDYNIRYINKKDGELFPESSQKLIGTNIDDLVVDSKSELQEAKRQVKEKGGWLGELNMLLKDKRVHIFQSRWMLLKDKQDNPESMMMINTDITEEKKLEKKLFRAQRIESINTLASGIAHDLNNILTPIIMSEYVLRKKISDKECLARLDTIKTNAWRAADLLNQIMSFSKGIDDSFFSTINITSIINEVKKIVLETFPRNIKLTIDVSDDIDNIRGNETQLQQVLMNLCLNARDAMPKGSNLSISAKNFQIDEDFVRAYPSTRVGSYIMICVSDTGVGISSEIKEKIFEPFFTTKDSEKGMGLGLSIVQSILKAHQGLVLADSEQEKGSTFKIYLPVVLDEDKPVKKKSTEETKKGDGEVILIIDDEPLILDIYKITLEKNGYNVLTALDGKKGVSVYAQHHDKIGAVIMDMMMPNMDGPAAAKELKRINAQVKIIGSSGLSKKNQRIAESMDFAAFLKKPSSAETILKTIHQVLNEK